ncbi:MAG: hypothetical protein GWN58_12710 [Anaerolineae bacterium]|nr:hypothetical protein [Anaerolineae bacterium]
MVRELQFARRVQEEVPPEGGLAFRSGPAKDTHSAASCQHRTVAKDGRIVCSRIVEGDSEVSPNVCRDCPFKAVNCGHLCFSLRQTSPSPLIVRYNGRTEIWDDGPCSLSFEKAACAAKVMPILDPRSCADCALHKPLQAPVKAPSRRPKTGSVGKVVAFPAHEPLAVAG